MLQNIQEKLKEVCLLSNVAETVVAAIAAAVVAAIATVAIAAVALLMAINKGWLFSAICFAAPTKLTLKMKFHYISKERNSNN